MNDNTQTTDVFEPSDIIKITKLDPEALFAAEEAIAPLLDRIDQEVGKHVLDVSTDEGRKLVASLAYRVARSKTIIDDLGKQLVAEWKAKSKRVDEVRKYARDRLDELKADTRKPLDDYEADLKAQAEAEMRAKQYDTDWDEAHQMHDLFERERAVREKEALIASQEAARQAKEQAEQRERDRVEREARIAQEAAETAKRQAEEAAARKERDRLLAEEAERKRLERLATNKKHRDRIHREAGECLVRLGYSEEVATQLTKHLADERINHVRFVY